MPTGTCDESAGPSGRASRGQVERLPGRLIGCGFATSSSDSSAARSSPAGRCRGALILLTYRPGGPLDLIVGLTTLGPDRDRHRRRRSGRRSRAAIAPSRPSSGSGSAACSCLIPSIVGVVDQLTGVRVADAPAVARGGLSVARGADRDQPVHGLRRWPAGSTAGPRCGAIGCSPGLAIGGRRDRPVRVRRSAAVAVANDLALRDRASASSRFGPTDRRRAAAAVRRAAVGRADAPGCTWHLDGTRRPAADRHRSTCRGSAIGDDFRWLAYVATSRQLGEYGSARGRRRGLGPHARRSAGASVARPRSGRGHARRPGARGRAHRRTTGRPPRTAASRSSRARGPGAAGSPSTARRSRRPSRRSAGSSATADLHRWRGQLDYWVFLDGAGRPGRGQRQRRGGRASCRTRSRARSTSCSPRRSAGATSSSILRPDDDRRRAWPVRDQARPAGAADPARRRSCRPTPTASGPPTIAERVGMSRADRLSRPARASTRRSASPSGRTTGAGGSTRRRRSCRRSS